MSPLADTLMPAYDVSDSVGVVVEGTTGATWEALMDVDLIEVGRQRPIVGMLGALRALPEIAGQLIHGERPVKPPDRLTLRAMTEIDLGDGGWVLLGERPGEEIALGLVGKFWRPVIEFASVEADAFPGFCEPGFAKTIYALEVNPLDEGHCLLTGTMRTACTDAHSRRWFRRYWTLGVGSGAHLLVQGLLDVAREAVEEGNVASGSPGTGSSDR
jgi:hypothetical protein